MQTSLRKFLRRSGWLPAHGRASADSLRRKRVIPLITEVFGGIRPQPARFLRQLSRVAAKHTTQDRTKYTRCARSYRTYHGQCISHAIVITDAHHIGEEIHNFKKQRLSRGGA